LYVAVGCVRDPGHPAEEIASDDGAADFHAEGDVLLVLAELASANEYGS
jgi:hypothetical protein